MAYWSRVLQTFVVVSGILLPGPSVPAHEEGPLRIAVVGDTGTGERAYHPGFMAVERAMRGQKPDVLLHLGDFVYQPKMFPESCPDRYIDEIEKTLVKPYPVRVFVAGDNDLAPKKWKPLASGCWRRIAPLATPFDTLPAGQPQPRELEGVVEMGDVLIAVVNTFPWTDPTPWLKPQIDRAKQKGRWVIVALHEPPLTTAWYLPDRRPELETLTALGADLILSGNQHSYERFSRLGRKVMKDEITKKYSRKETPVVVVSGGGGATFKPFADMEGDKEHSAPPEVFAALEIRALMNHFLILEAGHDALKGVTYRVCVGPAAKGDPRWRAGKAFWKNIQLACDGQPAGVAVFDSFEIRKN